MKAMRRAAMSVIAPCLLTVLEPSQLHGLHFPQSYLTVPEPAPPLQLHGLHFPHLDLTMPEPAPPLQLHGLHFPQLDFLPPELPGQSQRACVRIGIEAMVPPPLMTTASCTDSTKLRVTS
jgi:hypothetical protein